MQIVCLEGDQEASAKESGKSETRKEKLVIDILLGMLLLIVSSPLGEPLRNNKEDMTQNLFIGGQGGWDIYPGTPISY